MSIALSPRERQALKARAHALEPILTVGHAGLTPGVVRELEAALDTHELIKVRVGGDDREARRTLIEAMSGATGAALVGAVGKIAILWRERADED